MKTMEEIHAKYQELCTILGDINVKKKGLNNQETQLFKELAILDEEARKIQEPTSETK